MTGRDVNIRDLLQSLNTPTKVMASFMLLFFMGIGYGLIYVEDMADRIMAVSTDNSNTSLSLSEHSEEIIVEQVPLQKK